MDQKITMKVIPSGNPHNHPVYHIDCWLCERSKSYVKTGGTSRYQDSGPIAYAHAHAGCHAPFAFAHT